MNVCICGCGQRKGLHRHHCVFVQRLRAAARSEGMNGWAKRFQALKSDPDNLVWMHYRCHADHHNRVAVLPASRLPDSVYTFASRTLGPGAAYEYISRRYSGTDPRLTALLQEHEHGRSAAA